MRLAPLIVIELAAFVLIVVESYAFFALIVPLGPIPHDPLDYTVQAVVKLGLTFGLGLLWLVVLVALTRGYVRSRLRTRTPTPSS